MLEKGTVSIVGSYNVASKHAQHLAVVGGTGAYKQARGELSELPVSPTVTHDVLTLTR